ncbi:MAG: hypothetical protein ACTS6A_02695 [Candidatus Hodgkinia cicadicola]
MIFLFWRKDVSRGMGLISYQTRLLNLSLIRLQANGGEISPLACNYKTDG